MGNPVPGPPPPTLAERKQAAKLFVETHIGKLLGPGERGQPGHLSSNSHQREIEIIPKDTRHALRRLAWYKGKNVVGTANLELSLAEVRLRHHNMVHWVAETDTG